MAQLWDAQYDLANYLRLLLVFNLPWINTGEGHFAFAPSPLSYVPVSGKKLSDHMDFL